MPSGERLTVGERFVIRERLKLGETTLQVAGALGVSHDSVNRVRNDAGGIAPRSRVVSGHRLTVEDREEITRGLAAGWSFALIARCLGRPTSTVSREVAKNGGRAKYRAWTAERRAVLACQRPKVAKIAACPRLRAEVEAMLKQLWSPMEIARRLRIEYPNEPEMWVSHETIYQSLFVQGRGALRKELHRCLRSGRAIRRHQGAAQKRGRISNMIMISERPAEADDRAVPGHWEGDLIIGKSNASAIATLVERSTRFVMLCKITNQRAETVRDAITEKIQTLPDTLARSLTWDQGKEMARHVEFTVATGVPVYFCDPHRPWQRGSNENTNGLLRQWFPKGTSLSRYTQAELDEVARMLNGRPRQTLEWMKPSEKLAEFIASTG